MIRILLLVYLSSSQHAAIHTWHVYRTPGEVKGEIDQMIHGTFTNKLPHQLREQILSTARDPQVRKPEGNTAHVAAQDSTSTHVADALEQFGQWILWCFSRLN
jgi:hypothetical protein